MEDIIEKKIIDKLQEIESLINTNERIDYVHGYLEALETTLDVVRMDAYNLDFSYELSYFKNNVEIDEERGIDKGYNQGLLDGYRFVVDAIRWT